MNTQETTPKEQPPIKKNIVPHTLFAMIFFVVAVLGFADSTYLAVKKLSGSPVTCTIVHGCEIVTSSVYSEIFGIPVALLGSLFYLTLIILAVLYFDKKKNATLVLLANLTWIGLFASIYFMVVQAVILDAYCIYCIGSAITSSTLFVLGMVYLKKNGERKKKEKDII